MRPAGVNVSSWVEARRGGHVPRASRQEMSTAFVHKLTMTATLDHHDGCVNRLCFNRPGTLLASVSDDCQCVLWDVDARKAKTCFDTGHLSNVFGVRFLPFTNDSVVITGAMDGRVGMHGLDNGYSRSGMFECGGGRVKEIEVASEGNVFWSVCEEELIRQFDVREPHQCMFPQCDNVLISLDAPPRSMAHSEAHPQYVVVGSDEVVRLFDRRMLRLGHTRTSDVPCMQWSPLAPWSNTTWKNATFVDFSPRGDEILVNYSSEATYLLGLHDTNDTVALPVTPCSRRKYAREVEREVVAEWKTQGNEAFRQEKFTTAFECYSRALESMGWGYRPVNDPAGAAVLLSNRAISLLSREFLGDAYAALCDCDAALSLDPGSMKALYRRALALERLARYDEARQVAQEGVRRFPNVTHFTTLLDNEDDGEPRTFVPHDNVTFRYRQRYIAHGNYLTDIKEATFWGSRGEYILAGSDDGCFYVYDRATGALVCRREADSTLVNCVQAHCEAGVIATSGIDATVKIWEMCGRTEDREEFDVDALVRANAENLDRDEQNMLGIDVDVLQRLLFGLTGYV